MKSTSCVEQALREAKIVEALSIARFALGIHDRLLHTREGKQIEMDFRYEIRKIDEALGLLGVDTSQLIAPRDNGPSENNRRKSGRSAQTADSTPRPR